MCGIFGIYEECDCFDFLRRGIFDLQHRGQESSGLSILNGKNIYCDAKKGLFQKNFLAETKEDFSGKTGIAHVSLKESQPYLVEKSVLGTFAVAFSGNLINQQELEIEYDVISSRSSATEILARIIRKSESFADGIRKISEKVNGGWTIVILSPEKGIYAARDPFGFGPMVLGKSNHGCAISSESVAFNSLEMEMIRDVKPGEIVLIEENGFRTIDQLESERKAFCAFEWAYTARVPSVIERISVKAARENMGAALARNDIIEADLVSPVPLSGIGHAIGYSHKSGIPYDYVLAYNRYADRSFTADKKGREEIADKKLSIIPETVKGKVIILVDDSIVRGTQIRKLIFLLKKWGAKEVHLRIACPPLVAPCKYNISANTSRELIAASHSIEEIRKMIGAKTLIFNTIEDFAKAIGLAEKDLCLACLNKQYPL